MIARNSKIATVLAVIQISAFAALLGLAAQKPQPQRRLPPIKSTPERDAAGPADAAAKAKISATLETQFATLKRNTPIIKNTRAAEVEKNSTEMQALQKQRSFVETLKTQTNAAKANSGQTAPSNTGNEPVEKVGGPATAQGHAAPTPNPKAPASRAVVAVSPGGSNQLQEQTPKASSVQGHGQSSPDPRYTLSANDLMCKSPLSPLISRVNNATAGVVFTQDPASNYYVIDGRCFGDGAGHVYLSGAITKGRIDMVVKSWTPSRIEAIFDPNLRGVLDGWPDLVVQPTSSTPAKFPNNRFYAQRESVPLSSIPLNAARLANVNVGEFYYCPTGNQLGDCLYRASSSPLPNVANGIDRNSGLTGSSFAPGEDVYDLGQLVPGFALDGYSVSWYGDSAAMCKIWSQEARVGDSFNYSTQGYYGSSLRGDRQIVVDWGVDHCAWHWMGVFSVDDFYGAGYSLRVYVKGPIGIDPWTGKPN
jgi:hypothetical protein